MNKSYSNKALPAGTVLREWRLEEVLGVGGFGIVYKGRGIYFDELVAIKEYFPSAISERNEGDTVVPIDSQAEEVHALGLKKFVEEAKLLWNLSTPTRHPNIVSVRSLFEIHGTAYMVMDFEDGQSLSKLLREGKRFNEASLLALVKPIAEGLERAHRVGVLHRDIKPPNMLINEDGRPVLIDFGSARFESGNATSTKVTFHTPPYAAIEQYVKTYEQGPWTDIYALGVVLYECIAGEKPPEVLERLHGGLGSPLADGDWPGFSKTFLRAVDAAMTIRPAERPQSISEWLALFSRPDDAPEERALPEDFGEATRFAPFQELSEKIVPVAPPPPDFEEVGEIETPVPETTSEVQFKRAGHDTNASNTEAAEFLAKTALAAELAEEPPVAPEPEPEPVAASATEPKPAKAQPASAPVKKSKDKGLAIAAVAAVGVIGGAWYIVNQVSTSPIGGLREASSGSASVIPEAVQSAVAEAQPGGFATALQALATDAGQSGAPAGAVAELQAAAGRIATLEADRQSLSTSALAIRDADIAAQTQGASAAFANALGRDAEARGLRLAHDLPWADPRRMDAARKEPPQRQKIALAIRQARGALATAIAAAAAPSDPAQSIASALQALHASRGFQSLFASAYASKAGTPTELAVATPTVAAPVDTPSASTTPSPSPTPTAAAAATGGVSAGRMKMFSSVVASAREVAAQVISMGNVSKPGGSATKEQKDGYRLLQQSKTSAQGYQRYLDNLANSLRGAKSDREADVLISQAEQTKRYLNVLQSRSATAAQ